jgi:hypothetical protein
MKLISSQTASNSASISFTTGIDSTYKEYQFWFVDIHPRTDNAYFNFNMSTDGGSTYAVTKTTTSFTAYANEANSNTNLTYETARDLSQSTADQTIMGGIGSGADEAGAGTLFLYNPASTTYVKHFIGDLNHYDSTDFTYRTLVAGYGNTTTAVNAVIFRMSTGNFDGTILMYGIV